ncbi:MAG: hypothetical protein ABUT39_23440 [Acidobacteriota bacterium]
MKRYEQILLALFLACWLVYLLALLRIVKPEGTWNPGFYPYDTLAAAVGWGAGNLYVYRTRDLEEKDRRRFLPGYFLAPIGLILLLKVMMPVSFQRAAPFVAVWAFGVFSVFFSVATKLRIWGRRGGVG